MKRILAILYTIVFLTLSSPFAGAQGRNSSLRDTAEALLVDAVQAYDNGAIQAAVDRLTLILQSFPDNDAAHYYLGLCQAEMGNTSAAAKEFREAVRAGAIAPPARSLATAGATKRWASSNSKPISSPL